MAKQLELPVAGGLYVKNVEAGSPASLGGMSEGDIITHFNGQPIDDAFRPEELYDKPKPGERHAFTLLRAGRSIPVEVKMTSYPLEKIGIRETNNVRTEESYEYFDKSLGLGLTTLTKRLAKELRIPLNQKGTLVTEVKVGSPAYKEGLAAGMIVVRYNKYTTVNPKRYEEASSSEHGGMPVLMLIRSDKGKHLVVIKLP